MVQTLETPVRYLKGIGPRRAEIFKKLGISTIEDLLYFFPKRYEDRTHFVPIAKIKEGEATTIKGEVLARGGHQSYRRHGFNILEVAIGDKSGKVFCVWFNQSFLWDYFKVGEEVILYGKVEKYSGRLQMNNPEFEFIPSGRLDESLNIGRIVPIYQQTSGITQRSIRKTIKSALDIDLPRLNDFLPYDIRARHNLFNLAKALINIHFPEDLETQKKAYQRLAFEEFFLFQLPIILKKIKKKEQKGIAHKVEGSLIAGFFNTLPFALTFSQKKVISEIKTDMGKSVVMQRLLQGDVGSGKTVVATAAAVMAIQGGYQAAFMAPTEILARQHYEKIKVQFKGLRTKDKGLIVGLLVGSLNQKQKDKISKEISEGKIDLVIGTHALLEEGLVFKNLGLVVIDEQHKFGVGQRALLPQKGGHPDILIMTATPIPRTLAITLYGDLDISVINELPPGRKPIETLQFSAPQTAEVWRVARTHLKRGNQVYIVYPVIEESYALDMAGAKKMYEQLKRAEFKDFKVGLIHGRLKQKEQDEIMLKFRDKQLDILVSTTVLEVGIDVPNATCMIVEHAQRFGLSQLHQLRGRVGRGSDNSVCLLVSDAQSPEAKARIKAMVNYNDGFRIAEEDLKIRGPGEFFGARQHGLTELKIGDPLAQMQLLKLAREEAVKLLDLDPHLENRQNLLLKEKLFQRFPGYHKFMEAA